ncbi:MAG: sensor histidine kinase [Thermomicrobiales bacterium]
MFRPTIRLRLTLLYGGLFFIGGLIVLGGTYRLVINALPLGELQRRIDTLQETNPNGPQYRLIETQLRERRQALIAIREKARLVVIAVTIGAVLLGWFVAGRVLRPIQQITIHAQRASSENLGERIRMRGPPDELHELADTLDSMLDRLQIAFTTQRQFAGQVSHELRTPLTIMQAAADVSLADPNVTDAERELAIVIQNSVERSERLIDGLLMLSRSESTLLDAIPLDLADLAGGSLANAARAAGISSVLIEEGQLDPAPVRGDRVLLERLCDNLIDNAIAYNVPQGWLRVTTSTVGTQAEITVANSGPLVDPGRIEMLFQPFQRGISQGTQPVSGFGLGLAIVRSVTHAHGGTIDASALPEGGLTITVRLPMLAGANLRE